MAEIIECEFACGCSMCGEAIIRGTKFFYDERKSYHANHRINVCYKCLIKLGKEIEKEEKYFDELVAMKPKERNEKLKMIKGLMK